MKRFQEVFSKDITDCNASPKGVIYCDHDQSMAFGSDLLFFILLHILSSCINYISTKSQCLFIIDNGRHTKNFNDEVDAMSATFCPPPVWQKTGFCRTFFSDTAFLYHFSICMSIDVERLKRTGLK